MKKSILLIAFTALSSLSLFAQSQQADIQKAFQYLYLRDANAWESLPQNYNNGKWNNVEELKKYVHEYNMKMGAAGISFKISQQTFNNNTKVVGIFQNGTQIAADLVASGGGNLVASGGGNLIASGGGNLVASGGGNLVASGGGNIVVNSQTKGAGFGSSYTLSSAGTTVIKTSGTGALIIR